MREVGYYWCKLDYTKTWIILYWNGEGFLDNDGMLDDTWDDADISEVNEERIKTPDEK